MFRFLILFFLSLPLFAKSPQDLARSPKWLKLLHYKKTLLGSYESEADGENFFLATDGKTNPLNELETSVRLFGTTSKPTDDHPICKFPARFKWLNQELGSPWKVEVSGCKTYLSFFMKLAAKRASIVFSSYYLNNPNTAFGHTLIRLSRFEDTNETEMLDYGINFAAEARANNPFTYAIKGLFGGYKGGFSAIPYYYKIREYNDAEFRDLWSFELNLTQGQVFELVDHVWELGHTDFDYFYFDENCAYHLLALLDVVMPEQDLTANFPLSAIPSDTVRFLAERGLITKGIKRESIYSRLLRGSKNESEADLFLAKTIIETPEQTSALIASRDSQSAARILDVAMDAFDYKNADKILGDDPVAKEKKSHILRARAMNPVVSTDSGTWKTDQTDSPALGHRPVRFTFYDKYEGQNGGGVGFEFRSTFHDLLDPQRGMMKEGQIEMGKLNFALQNKGFGAERLRFEEFTLASVKNFPGQNFWSSNYSWEVDIGVRQLGIKQCFDCPEARASGSIGNSVHLFDGKWLIATLLNLDLGAQSFYQTGYRIGAGPKIYSRVLFSDKWAAGFSATYLANLNWERSLLGEGEIRYHFMPNFSLALRSTSKVYQNSWNVNSQLGLQYFY